MMLIEIVIGLAFIYLSAALFCSLLQEWIAAQTAARAKLLRQAIERMVGTDATLSVYAHPMVATASESALRPPSYLSSAAFARAVVDGLRSPSVWTKPPSPAEIEAALARIPHLPLRDALASLYGETRGDVAAFEKRVAAWFDDTMARTSGWYKRKAHTILFGLGFLTAIGFNLDTFLMAARIRTNAALRSELVAAAEKRVQDGTDKVVLQDAMTTLNELPFGWKPHLPEWSSLQSWDGWMQLGKNLARTIVGGLPGWIVTALAISLGAPFWFDLLSKVINLRGTGPKPVPRDTGSRDMRAATT